MQEIWKDIQEYENLYQISNLGNVRSLKNRWGFREKPRIVKQQLSKKGYMRVRLSKNNKSKIFMTHRLVYETFIGNIGEDFEINHIDCNRKNNMFTNLEKLTHADNVRYSKAKKIMQLDNDNKIIKEWNCIRDVERNIGIDHRQICDCLLGKQKTCHGYKWVYKEG